MWFAHHAGSSPLSRAVPWPCHTAWSETGRYDSEEKHEKELQGEEGAGEREDRAPRDCQPPSISVTQ